VLAVAALWVAEPVYSSYAIDQLLKIAEGEQVNLWLIFGIWGGIFLLLSVTQAFEKYFSWKIDNLLILERRKDLYEHVLALDITYHTQQKSGEVIKIIDDGADNIMEMQRHIFIEFIPSLLASVVFLILGFLIQPLLAVILLVSLGLYMIMVVFGLKKTMAQQYEVNKLWVESIGRAFDTTTNIFSVKSSAQEKRELGTMQTSDGLAHVKQLAVNKKWALIEAVNFFMLTRILLIAVGILLLVHGKLTLGQLYFFQFSFFRVLTPFEILSGLLPQWNRKVGKIKLSQQILDTPVRISNMPQPVILENLQGAITFENMHFSYDAIGPRLSSDDDSAPEQPVAPDVELSSETDQDFPDHQQHMSASAPHDDRAPEKDRSHHERGRDVLHSINLTIRPGEHIAFVGHSGAGKSTLAMLLTRFYDVTEGRITVDGTDMRSLDVHWWRSQIGLVLQENIMFNDSILENIRYARPNATLEEVRDAARRAAAAEFIEKLSKGYDTLIGDRGIRLSGGQRQRVAIARAILKRPKIVVLDEATSALDSVTERRVQEGIKELISGRTSCIIAHRLSTVRSVDRIAVLDKGFLIAVDTHEELMKSCALYKEMVELQSQGMLAE